MLAMDFPFSFSLSLCEVPCHSKASSKSVGATLSDKIVALISILVLFLQPLLNAVVKILDFSTDSLLKVLNNRSALGLILKF